MTEAEIHKQLQELLREREAINSQIEGLNWKLNALMQERIRKAQEATARPWEGGA